MRLKVFTDGGVRTGGINGPTKGKSGRAAIGCVVRDLDNKIVRKDKMAIGEATVNEAEYSGLIRGLFICRQMGAAEVEVYADSQLVINQMNGEWQIKNQELREYNAEVWDEVKHFNEVVFTWVPREQNQAADELTRDILG